MHDNWQDEVLSFWFGELTAEDWFAGGETLDTQIRTRFSMLYEKLKTTLEPKSIHDARSALAAVIALDQFPRNMFRGQPEAFGTDNLAIEITRNAIDNQLDHGLSNTEKQFLYMPLMHSEISADQERCVDLFRSLDNDHALKFAIDHRDIIQQFGRFPHRNHALGRHTSEAEKKFLDGHEGYGQ